MFTRRHRLAQVIIDNKYHDRPRAIKKKKEGPSRDRWIDNVDFIMDTRTRRLAGRIADLAQSIQRLEQKFNFDPRTYSDLVQNVAQAVPEQQLEWVLTSIQKGSGRWPEDKPRFLAAFEAYQKLRGDQKFRTYLTQFNSQLRNPLNYTLHQIEGAADAAKPPEKSKSQIVRDVKQQGAKVIYDQESYKIIQIGGEGTDIKQAAQAACYYAKGTKWCTSDADTAETYLEDDPLYVIFAGGVKVAQLHQHSNQLLDLQDNEFNPDPKLLSILLALKLLTPDLAVEHAARMGKRIPAVEAAVVTPDTAVRYAKTVIKGRWPEAEQVIASSASSALDYAEHVIGGRWPPGEPAILKRPTMPTPWSYDREDHTELAVKYATHVLKTRWPEAEEMILLDGDSGDLRVYAEQAIRGRWPAAEKKILTDPSAIVKYAELVIGGRWPEGESLILRDESAAYLYARNVIKGRWPAAEKVVISNLNTALAYIKFILKAPWPAIEKKILATKPHIGPYLIEEYLRDSNKGRWPELEALIKNKPKVFGMYLEEVVEIYEIHLKETKS